MVVKLFRLCDQYVHIDDFVVFEDKFSKITKKYKIDLHELYYGRPYKDMKKTYKRYDKLRSAPKYDKVKAIRAAIADPNNFVLPEEDYKRMFKLASGKIKGLKAEDLDMDE